MGEGIGMNFSSSMEVAKIATQMAISTREEEEKLKEKYKRIREIFNEQQPYIGLYSSYYAVNSSWTLKGNICANWYNIFIDINNWYKN